MPIYWKRYGVADSIEYPLIKRGVVDFAVSSDYTPVQSDVRIHVDAASASYAANVQLATGSHGWSLPLLSSELSGKRITVAVIDAATKAVEDQFIIIETYGSPLAQHPFDLSINTVTVATVSSGAITDASLNNSAVFKVTSNVWATSSRTLSSIAIDDSSISTSAVSKIAAGVWATPSTGQARTDLVNHIWATPSRTLTSLGTGVIGDETFKNSGIYAITSNVWTTASRGLSQASYDQLVNEIWATPSRTLTSLSTDQISAAAISAAAGSKIADIVLRRTYANARGSSDGDTLNFRSLLGATGKLVNKVAVSGANLIIYQEDDATSTAPGGTQAITTDSAAVPIVSLDTA